MSKISRAGSCGGAARRPRARPRRVRRQHAAADAGRRSARTSRPACSGSSTCSPRARHRTTCSTISTSTSSPTTRPASCAPASASRTRCPFGARAARARRARRHPPHGAAVHRRHRPGRGVARAGELWNDGYATTVDLLGEKTLTLRRRRRVRGARARHARRARAAPRRPGRRSRCSSAIRGATLPRVNISVKASALAPLLAPATADEGIAEALDRLGPILDAARAVGRDDPPRHRARRAEGRHVPAAARDRRALPRRPAARLRRPGVPRRRARRPRRPHRVVGRHARPPVADPARQGRVLGRRDDQGARAGLEVAGVAQQGRDRRVVRSVRVDARRERAATSGRRSRATTRAASPGRCARRAREGLPDDAVEVQVLHGMAEPLHDAVRDLGVRTRVYVPVGELVPGMAYLVRRLLENTSNESFVRHRVHRGLGGRRARRATAARRTRAVDRHSRAAAADRSRRARPLRQRAAGRAAPRRRADALLVDAVDRVERELDFPVPLLIDGVAIDTRNARSSRSIPGRTT